MYIPRKHTLAALIALSLAACSSNPSKDQEPVMPEGKQSADSSMHTTGHAATGSAEYAKLESATAERPDGELVYFEFDSDRITSRYMALLEEHAAHLSAHPGKKVILEGHADERGTPEYNVALGERRAKAVEQALLIHGASPEQFDIVSYGESRPVVEGHGESSYAKNRRVELVYR